MKVDVPPRGFRPVELPPVTLHEAIAAEPITSHDCLTDDGTRRCPIYESTRLAVSSAQPGETVQYIIVTKKCA